MAIILLSCLTVQSQSTIDSLLHPILTTNKTAITPNVINNTKDLYLYNNKKDTLQLLTSIFDECTCDEPKLFNSIQLDAIGQKEVVIMRNCKERKN